MCRCNHFEDGMDERDSEDGDEASTDNEHLMTNCNLAIKILCKKNMHVKHFKYSTIGSSMILKIVLKVFLRLRNHTHVAIYNKRIDRIT